MYPLLETIKIVDGRAQHLKWHQRRVDFSIDKYYGQKTTNKLIDSLNLPQQYSRGIVKARYLYNDSSYIWEFESYVLKAIKSLKIVFDDNIDYELKYSDRSYIEKLYKNKGECDDVLIVKNGMITDSSYCNIVLFDGINWITPSLPLLKGTCRERLLYECRIIQGVVKPDRLSSFESFKLINAMRDLDEIEELPISRIFL